MVEYLNSNLESLVNKVHEEGLEKGNEEARQIIAGAKQQSEDLLKKAEQKIEKMEGQAQNEITRMRENLISELNSVAQQTMSMVKTELAAIIINKIKLP